MVRSGAEKCTLVFGIISIGAATVGIAVFIGLTVYVITELDETIDNEEQANNIIYLSAILGLLFIFFLFDVILLNGVYKKKYNQVLAYIVFGVLVTALSLAGAVTYTVLRPREQIFQIISGVWLFFTLTHVVILLVVGLAYRNIKLETQPKRPVLTLSRREMKQMGVAK